MYAALVCFGLMASSQPSTDLTMIEPLRVTWDLNLEGGVGVGLPAQRLVAFGRVRAGVMMYRYPWYVSVGPTYELSTLALASFGAQAELLHLGAGFWLQLGASLSTAAQAGAMASVGWSIVGVEGQWRAGTPAQDWAILGKLRIPVAFIVMAIAQH